jgi:hypothetical protein
MDLLNCKVVSLALKIENILDHDTKKCTQDSESKEISRQRAIPKKRKETITK